MVSPSRSREGHLSIKKTFLSQPFSRLLHHANAVAREAPQTHHLYRHAVLDRAERCENPPYPPAAVALRAHAEDARAGIATELVHGSQENRGSNQMA